MTFRRLGNRVGSRRLGNGGGVEHVGLGARVVVEQSARGRRRRAARERARRACLGAHAVADRRDARDQDLRASVGAGLGGSVSISRAISSDRAASERRRSARSGFALARARSFAALARWRSGVSRKVGRAGGARPEEFLVMVGILAHVVESVDFGEERALGADLRP